MEGKDIGDALTPEEARAQSEKYRQDMAALFADAELGRRVREVLERPHASPEFILAGTNGGPAGAWDWLRWVFLGLQPSDVPGSLATGGATGEEPPSAEVLDLMQALKDSMKQRTPPPNDLGTSDAVEAWNAANPPGTWVVVTGDHGTTCTTKTRSAAWMLGFDGSSSGHSAVVLLDGRSGAYLLSRCKPLVSKEGA